LKRRSNVGQGFLQEPMVLSKPEVSLAVPVCVVASVAVRFIAHKTMANFREA